MRRNIRLILFVLTLIMILAPAIPVLAENGNDEILRVGSRGKRVTELQTLLQEAGFFPANKKVTGYFGWITFTAVTALEKKNGLKVDGQVGREEWNILYGSRSPKVVLGYYTVDYPGDKLSQNSLVNSSRLVNQAAMFDFRIDSKGNISGKVSYEGIREAGKKGAKALMVVHNFINGAFDPWTGYGAVASAASRSNLVDNIVRIIENNGYDGVNIDLEGLPAEAKAGYNAFLKELGARLKARSKLLTVAIPAKTGDAGNSWSGAYDYRTIGRLADYVVIMTYDEHWIGGPPGPVASLPWVKRVIDYSVSTIPPQKVLMGVGCYGYDWPAGQNGKTVKWKDLPGLIKSYGNVKWDNYYSVPYLTYTKNGVYHQVWFENQYSLAIKLKLAENYGLGGIAMWRLGFEDATFWDTIKKKLAPAS